MTSIVIIHSTATPSADRTMHQAITHGSDMGQCPEHGATHDTMPQGCSARAIANQALALERDGHGDITLHASFQGWHFEPLFVGPCSCLSHTFTLFAYERSMIDGTTDVCGALQIAGEIIPFEDLHPSPLHALDSQATLAAILSLVTHETDAEEAGSICAHELEAGPDENDPEHSPECYWCMVDYEEEKWIRYYDDGQGESSQDLIWGDRIVRSNVGDHDTAFEMLHCM